MVFGSNSHWCRCCCISRRRRLNNQQRNNNNNNDDDDEDSEVYMYRQRRAQRLTEQAKQREEFLSNVLVTKTAVYGRTTDNEEDFFPIGNRQDGEEQQLQLQTQSELQEEEEEDTGDEEETTNDEIQQMHDKNDTKEDDKDEDEDEEVDISCTICLIQYEEGDKVCFSHNPKCTHHFHKQCVMEWLKDHDECPCCRCNYLAFSDDGNENDNNNNSTRRSLPNTDANTINQNDSFIDASAMFLARLYQTGIFEPTTTASPPPPHDSQNRTMPVEAWQLQNHDTGWEERLEQWRSQVQEHIRIAQQRLREQQDNAEFQRRSNHDNSTTASSAFEQRMGQSLERARMLRQQILDREPRETLIQSVQERLHNVANSESARQLRDTSQRTIQSIFRYASERR